MITVEIKVESERVKNNFLTWFLQDGVSDFINKSEGVPNTVERVNDTVFLTTQEVTSVVEEEEVDLSELSSASSEKVDTELNGNLPMGGLVQKPTTPPTIVPGLEDVHDAAEVTTEPFAPEVHNEGALAEPIAPIQPEAEFSPNPEPSNVPY